MRVFLVILLVLAGPLHAKVLSSEDLIGVWGSSEDQGKTFWGFDQYAANGKLISWGTLPDSELSFELEGHYEVLSDQQSAISCIVITRSSHPDMLAVGDEICSLIVKLSATELHYVDTEGEYHVLYKQNLNQQI